MSNPTCVRIERYPFGRTHAISLVDDTDGATVAQCGPVYDLLADHGLLCTKTVWPLRAASPSGAGAAVERATDTLEDPTYRALCLTLAQRGFEVAMHTASGGNNDRRRTLRAYALFESIFGAPPATNVMHGRNRENLYWAGQHTRHGGWRAISRVHDALSRRRDPPFEGHVPASPWFWGDVCLERTRYVRFFETLRTDTLAFDPSTPYHDPSKPFVSWWFSASYGAGSRLLALLTPERVAELAANRGASILHTYCTQYGRHSSMGRRTVHPGFAALARQLGDDAAAWVVPVATLLDRLRAVRDVEIGVLGTRIVVCNVGDLPVGDLALACPEGVRLHTSDGDEVSSRRSALGQVLLGELAPRASLTLTASRPVQVADAGLARSPRPVRLALGTAARVAWQHWQTYSSPQRTWSRLVAPAGVRPEVPWTADLAGDDASTS